MKHQIVIFLVCALVATSVAEFKCEKGTPYKENNCNSCNCLDGGLLACTEIACLGDEYQRSFNCVEGTVTQNNCNTCTCVEGQGTICTNHKC
ncbi:serine protease inhibitor I/II-like [Photinus pyralis]|nr:serine protease inhibitor I/II-like [Photinus pyralis]